MDEARTECESGGESGDESENKSVSSVKICRTAYGRRNASCKETIIYYVNPVFLHDL